MAALSTFTLPCSRLQCQTIVKSKRSNQSFYTDKSMMGKISTGPPKLRSQIARLEDLSPSRSRSPVETIQHLYECINNKNVKELDDLISKDCFVDDYSFFTPFRGKKETIRFFEQLIRSMGRNIKFDLDLIIFEKDGSNVAVTWHLEWKKQRIPLTRGCSFYECSMLNESNLVLKYYIRKAHVLVESPIKPGAFALGLLMIITSLFDAFPQATKWFLDRPYVIANIILKIYGLTLGPFISPFLKYYPKVFNFVTFLIDFIVKILLFVSKIYPF